MVGNAVTNVASGGAGTGAITYQSSNTSVLTVNATSGVATGVVTGTATVTATKAADAGFTQAQATYSINVTPTAISAWIGLFNSQVTLPQLAVGKVFERALVELFCGRPPTVLSCSDSESDLVTSTTVTDSNAKLNDPAYFQLRGAAGVTDAVLVAARRFPERIGHAALFFDNRYWVIGGGIPQLPAAAPAPHQIQADVWSSVDGKTWQLETGDAPFGRRWFHQAVVHNGEMWVISGASTPNNFLTDAWSSPDGFNWTQHTANMGLPWYSTHLNVVVFNGAMWAVSGGTTFSSADGVTWTPRSAVGAIAGANGRGYASLNVYNGSLWYIAGSPGLQAAPADVVNDVWKSSDGISWTQVTASASFAKRMRHQSFVMNERLWVFGGEISDGAGGSAWALDAWSTTDGATWTVEPTGGLDAAYLAKVVEQTGPQRVTLIGGIQRGYSNHVWQTINGLDWTSLSANAQFSPRTPHGASFNGQLWLIGGATIDSKSSGADSDEIWRSDNGIDWIRVTPSGTIFSPRDGHSVVVFQNKLWVIGGWDGSIGLGGTETRLNDVWSSSDGVAWTKHVPASGIIFAPRSGQDVAVFANKLWVIGGSLQNSDANDVWSSPDGVTWTLVQASAAFSARRSQRVIAFANELWLTGGGTTTGTSDVWHSPDGVTWTQVNPVGSFPPRQRHESAVFNGRLYVVGGTSGEDYTTGTPYSDVWSSADGTTWRQDATVPGFAARSQPALTVLGGELWLAGGFGLSFFNDVWRSSDGVNWRVGYIHDIAVP